MNGQHKEHIITTSLRAPTGLTIDYPNNKLFWLDSKMHHIESSDLDGKSRRRVVYNLHHPFDVAVFGDNVYWSDSILKTVSSANKFTGENKTVLIYSENITSFVPKGISIHHSLSQPSGKLDVLCMTAFPNFELKHVTVCNKKEFSKDFGHFI